ncbi:P1 family peptidase [Phytoactinopolyspora limicola]|uniref:P1 family peptidase n=1 Tax=Phytoactinopolyspora limicola TaxID=2715536 RepID=UPI001A9CAA80|nr:P1 family peptidase [Phytoactinopolyspora limicola]
MSQNLTRRFRRVRAPLAVAAAGALLFALTAPAQADPDELSNTITDVPGIKVGQYTQFGDGYRTGTTVILTEDGATTGYSQQGGGPGTKETDLLEPGGLVTEAHAVVLSGGSAYGLDAASGVMRWLEERGVGYPVGGGVVPIVPSAILYDLGRGGDFQARPDAEFGYLAAENASTDPVEMGRVGAGMGANWGLGSASIELPNGYRVGAIVGLNPGGSPVNPDTCRPYAEFLEIGNEFNLTKPNKRDCPDARPGNAASVEGMSEEPFNTTIAVVATDAPLDQTQAQRMAMIANSGLARSIRPVHNLGDGDTVFAMATTTPAGGLSNNELSQIYNAGADALGRAVVHAMLETETIGNHRSYCDRYPSACKHRDRPGAASTTTDTSDNTTRDSDDSAVVAPAVASNGGSTGLLTWIAQAVRHPR